MKKILLLLALGGIEVAASLLQAETASAEASEGLAVARRLNEAFAAVAKNSSAQVVVIKVTTKTTEPAADAPPPADQEDLSPELRRLLEEHLPDLHNSPPFRSGSADSYDSQGSGIIFSSQGHILTNRHVVENADTIRVKLADGSEHAARICGLDAISDLALLQVPLANLQPAKLGTSSRLRIGEFAIAIGAPFDLDYSVTFGHISAKGRNNVLSDANIEQDFIQTDAQINPGSSGGPLLNIEGEVIGINTLIRGVRTGIGFAIPIDRAKEIAQELMHHGRYARTWLGIGVQALREDPVLRLAVPEVREGLLVKTIEAGGPARKSQLRAGDVIVAIDGRPAVSSQDLKSTIQSRKAGDLVALEVLRGSQRLKVPIRAEPMPETEGLALATSSAPTSEQDERLGIAVRPLTSEQAEREGLTRDQGVWVAQVAPGSLAEHHGIKSGQILTEINRRPISSPRQFKEVLRAADPRNGIALGYLSEGSARFEFVPSSAEK
jgi:serine protease Do